MELIVAQVHCTHVALLIGVAPIIGSIVLHTKEVQVESLAELKEGVFDLSVSSHDVEVSVFDLVWFQDPKERIINEILKCVLVVIEVKV